MESVFGQAEEVEHPGGGIEMNLARLLPERERGDPNGDEPILAERQTKLRVREDLQKAAPVPPSVAQLSERRTAEGKPAQNEWSRLKGELLVSVLTLFADEQNGFYLLCPTFCYSD